MSEIVLKELSPEQEAALPKQRLEWLRIGLDTTPANRPAAEDAARRAYENAGLPFPTKLTWINDPFETPPDWDAVFYGQHEAGACGFYEYFMKYCPEVKGLERIQPLIDLAKACGWVWLYPDEVIFCERPESVVLEGDPYTATTAQRLHNTSGPAVKWRSGREHYFIRGISVPKEVVTGQITLDMINKEQNAEVRRVMLERFGSSRYLQEMKAKPIHQDLRGTLFRAEIPGDEPLTAIRFINRTPEIGKQACPECGESKPSGGVIKFSAIQAVFDMNAKEPGLKQVRSQNRGNFCKCGASVLTPGMSGETEVYKVYWHRVPPDTRTATQAYEWMYDVKLKDFEIVDES